ncbi:MAG: 50S ribosomal protein L24 [Methylobacter sp.]|nr:50S ribosomal protein L24 [Methylococcales bacterium]MDD5112447.1 50S ribosomal protein L24 [Methylobacter sp.]
MQKIKKGDDVVIIAGKDKGKSGRVSKVLSSRKILVDGINQYKKTQKSNPNSGVSGGIVTIELPIDISNVGLYNPVTKRPDRVGFKLLENGNKVRFFKSTNEVVDV